MRQCVVEFEDFNLELAYEVVKKGEQESARIIVADLAVKKQRVLPSLNAHDLLDFLNAWDIVDKYLLAHDAEASNRD